MKIIKLLSIFTAIAIFFTFCGCAKADNSSDTDSSKLEVQNEIELDITNQEKMLEKANGTVMRKIGEGDYENYSEYDLQSEMEFMERYGIEIEYIPMGYSEYVSKLPQMVAAGNPPDYALMTDATALSFMYGNCATPLNQYLDLNDEAWDESYMELFSIDGNYYGLNTTDTNTFYVYYNKTLFEELGLEDPYNLYENGKWTFDKLRELAKKATVYESDNTTVSCYGIGTHYKEVFALAFGGNIIEYNRDTNMYETKLKSAATISGLNFLRNLIADGSMNPSVTGFTEFPFRKIAMFVERPWHAIGNYDLFNTMKDEIGMVPLPASPIDGKYYAASNMVANFVPANAQNPEAGALFSYFVLRRAIRCEQEKTPSFLATRAKSMTDEHVKIIDEYLDKAILKSSKLESITGWSNYSEQFWSGLIWEKKSAEEVSAAMENIVSSALKKTIGE